MMRQLTNLETGLLLFGGLLMVLGAGANLFLQAWAAWLFAPGAVLFGAMQWRQRYDGPNIAVRRLRRMMLFGDVLFLLAALLMIANQTRWLPIGYLYYIKYVHNNWIVVLLIAAILQLYTSHRIAHELEKEPES